MSMNFSEFKKLMGADPRNRDPETSRVRHSAPEFETVAREAEAFEEKLESALLVQPPTDLLNDIKAISQQPAKPRRSWMPLALAASFIMTIGVVTLVWKQSHQWESVEAYVADHYAHDGSKLVARATEPVARESIDKIMAKLGAEAGDQLSSRIQYIKYCPTPEGRGVHMVVSSDQGPMTILFMPETQVTDGEMVEFDQMHAMLVNLEHGSAAIVGDQSQSVENLQAMIRSSLKTSAVGV